MLFLYLLVICITLTLIASFIGDAYKHAKSKRAEVDKLQIESAFPAAPAPPVERPTLAQQEFETKVEHRQQILNSQRQALEHLLSRRSNLNDEIGNLRSGIQTRSDKQYAQWRTDSLTALADARKEQQELTLEQEKLLSTMKVRIDETELDAAEKSLQPDPRGPVAQRVDDPSELHDVELYEQETGRKSFA